MRTVKRSGILTKKQAEAGKYIESFIKKNGYRPTLKRVAKHFGLSAKSSMWSRYRGYVKNKDNCPFCGRNIKVE